MGYKMSGAPMMDTSKKHGTNANLKKSGMMNPDGTEAPGAPFIGGSVKNVVGGAKNLLGLGGSGKASCPPTGPTPPPVRPPEPGTGGAATTTTATATPAGGAAAEEEVPAATMKKNLKVGAPNMKTGSYNQKFEKKGAPHRRTFGQTTSYTEVDSVKRHNDAHKNKEWDSDHRKPKGKGKYVLKSDAMDKETNQESVKQLNKKKADRRKAKKVQEAIEETTSTKK